MGCMASPLTQVWADPKIPNAKLQNSGSLNFALQRPTSTPRPPDNRRPACDHTDKMANVELTVQSERAFQKQPHSECLPVSAKQIVAMHREAEA